MDARGRAIVLGGGLLVSLMAGCGIRETDQPAATPVTTTRATLSPAPATGVEMLDDGTTVEHVPPTIHTWDAAAGPAAAATAEAAMRLFARRDVPAAQWWTELAPLLSPAAAQPYRHTDPARVPATQITGTTKVLTSSVPAVARVSVPTNAGVYLVILSRNETGGWQVERFTPPEGPGDAR